MVYGLPRLLRSLAMTAHTNSSLRELLATRGNLSMGYNYSFMEFFFFSVFVLAISDLWGFASLCKGGCCEATGGLRKKLKHKVGK